MDMGLYVTGNTDAHPFHRREISSMNSQRVSLESKGGKTVYVPCEQKVTSYSTRGSSGTLLYVIGARLGGVVVETISCED